MLCQLNILAMDLPDIPEAVAAFSALATAGAGGKNLGDKDNKEEKGKGKANRKRKRKSGGGKDKDSDPIRPSDPLPDARRTRLGSFLQPISTMLDSCTVTRATIPAGDGAGGAGNGGRGVNSSRNEVTNASNSSRAYDGTLADFMGLALVEHFASRIPRTLSALFDDFERLPPDSLTAALTKSSTRAPSDGGTMVGLTGGEGDITGEEETAGKEVADVVEPALSGTALGNHWGESKLTSFAKSERVWGFFVQRIRVICMLVVFRCIWFEQKSSFSRFEANASDEPFQLTLRAPT